MIAKIILAFILGGAISALVQVFIDKTALTPARILVALVVSGVFLYAIGLYEPLFDTFGTGISLPLLGFGASIARGVREAIDESGAIGILTGGLSGTSAGITAALILGLLAAVFGKGRKRHLGR